MVSSFKTLSSPQLRATPRGESLVLLSPLLIFACLCSASFLQCAGEGEVPWLAPPLALETTPEPGDSARLHPFPLLPGLAHCCSDFPRIRFL